jgi:hypothetical protein
MFWAVRRSSSGAPNCIFSLWFIYTCGDQPLSHSALTTAGHHMSIYTSGCKYSLELLMMRGVPLEAFWAFNKLWNNKFYYKVASCWLFLLTHTAMHGYMSIKCFPTWSKNKRYVFRKKNIAPKICLFWCSF